MCSPTAGRTPRPARPDGHPLPAVGGHRRATRRTTCLLRQAMASRAELDPSSYDRSFPSQDFMPKGSVGNLIALPLHGERRTAGATAFLDPTTPEPWPDQWEFLPSVARISPDAVAALSDTLRRVEAGPTLTLSDLMRQGGPSPPEVVRDQLGARLSNELPRSSPRSAPNSISATSTRPRTNRRDVQFDAATPTTSRRCGCRPRPRRRI